MKSTIWKYMLEITDTQLIHMPNFPEPLCVQSQDGIPHLWCRVYPELPMKMRRINIFGTGHELPEFPGAYIGTVQDAMGLVWHVYDGDKNVP